MAGFDNEVVYGKNADFTARDNQNVQESNGLVTNGQMWIGSTALNAGNTHINVGTITSPLGTLSVGYSSPNITLDLAGGSTGIDSVGVDATSGGGTNPVVPTAAGLITNNGATVAAGTNPVRTVSTAANVYQTQIQRSQAIASTDATKVGLAAFDSAAFAVDGNGFVTSVGGGTPTVKIGVDGATPPGTNPVVANGSGQINFTGQIVAAGTSPLIAASVAANTVTYQAQLTQAIAAADNTKVGLANFDSASFSVSNGFVTTSSTGIGKTITGQSGGALSPTLGNWNISGGTTAAGTSPVVTSGSGSTLTTNVQRSQAIASADATKVGLCNFDSAAFAVDANGFVTLAGGGLAIDSIGVDATSGTGTNPVLPTVAGLVTVNGARVAAGTNPIRAVSTAANVYQIQVQTSQALAATDATKVGLCNFDSASFGVDANGFVTFTGSTGGTTWNDVSGAFSPLKSNGYFVTATATGTLPASPAQGDTIKFFVDTTQILTIQASGSQIIRFGSAVTAAGGTAVSTARGDSVELTYRTSGTCWCLVGGAQGTWTLT